MCVFFHILYVFVFVLLSFYDVLFFKCCWLEFTSGVSYITWKDSFYYTICCRHWLKCFLIFNTGKVRYFHEKGSNVSRMYVDLFYILEVRHWHDIVVVVLEVLTFALWIKSSEPPSYSFHLINLFISWRDIYLMYTYNYIRTLWRRFNIVTTSIQSRVHSPLATTISNEKLFLQRFSANLEVFASELLANLRRRLFNIT